ESAARAYAQAIGVTVEKLEPAVFAGNPVVVRVGGSLYVRALTKVNPDESLTFACAIDEGIVLTVARSLDIEENLRDAFRQVERSIGKPKIVIGCDCILRGLELDQRKLRDSMGKIMVENQVCGFGTYGEQYNAMHLNQTLTGIAFGQRTTEA
ncbi:MAG: FIST C-terminal domain-containing protein, partial [Hyphomicrobium sp.]